MANYTALQARTLLNTFKTPGENAHENLLGRLDYCPDMFLDEYSQLTDIVEKMDLPESKRSIALEFCEDPVTGALEMSILSLVESLGVEKCIELLSNISTKKDFLAGGGVQARYDYILTRLTEMQNDTKKC